MTAIIAHLCGDRNRSLVCELPDGHAGQHAGRYHPSGDVVRWLQNGPATLAYLCRYCAWSTRELVAECPKCGETHFAPMGPGSGNLPASVTLASRSSSSPAHEERE